MRVPTIVKGSSIVVTLKSSTTATSVSVPPQQLPVDIVPWAHLGANSVPGVHLSFSLGR